MRKSIIFALAATAMVISSCNDMLDKDPRDEFTNTSAFWNSENSVQSYTNKFYTDYIGYSQNGGSGWFYFQSLGDDQTTSSFENWTYDKIPNTSSYWTDGFTEVRRANYVLQNLESSTLSDAKKAYYNGVARLNRAWAYYKLVRMYGDVQWLDQVILDPDDSETIYGAREDRDAVMDKVLADLDYAIANIGASSDKTAWSSDMARAMKADICLYEGTYCKYRTQADNGKAADATRAAKYLTEAANAANDLISSGKYALTDNYGDVYNSISLTANKEIIFCRHYEKDVVMHGLVDYTCGSSTIRGITKDAFDAFLFTDGKPLASTSCDKNDKAVLNKDNDCSIAKVLSVRDKRLSVLVDSIVCFKGHGWARINEAGDNVGGSQMTSSTGYTIRKYDNMTLEAYYRTNTTTGYTDAPLYWLAEVYLAYAEAKAELGTITQDDLNNTINKLQSRAGLPDMTLTPAADPANNHGVSNLIWEIRRCRRCELMTDNWYRYWDMVRWHQLDKFDSNNYPNINRGANLSSIPDVQASTDANGYVIACSKTREYNKKYYFFPIPTNELNLNSKLTQNPGWTE